MISDSRFVILFAKPELLASKADCNCACPSSPSEFDAPILPAGAVVELHPQQQRIALDENHSVVFVPSISRVVVANQAALQLLDRFRQPQPLDGDPDELAAARQFVQLGLLREHGSRDVPPLPADELVAWLHVTNACNLRCTYCFVDKDEAAMSEEVAVKSIKTVLRAAQQHGYRRVLLKYAGGEASLNLALVELMHRQAYTAAEAAGLTLRGVVLSNGVGLTNHKLQRIRDLGLQLMISLDGLADYHDAQRPTIHGQGSFKGAVAGITRAQQLGLDLTISVTVTGPSAEGLPELIDWLTERDLYFTINFYRENDCSASFAALKLDEHRLINGMRAAYKAIERRPPRRSLLGSLLDRVNLGAAHSKTCAVGENYLVIDHHGNIAKCQMDLAHPVTTIWERDPLNVIRLDTVGVQNLPVDQKAGCRDCEWRYWCSGGCAVATFRATGRYDIQSPNCAIYRALYPDVLRLEGLRLLHWAGDPADGTKHP